MERATLPVRDVKDAAPGAEERSSFKSGSGFVRVLNATRYSWLGLRAAWIHEAAFRQELVIGVPFVVLAIFTAPSRIEAVALIGSIVLAWVVELLNSGIEAVADAVSLKPNPLIGRAKDLGSAAVMLSVMFAVATWAVIYWPRFT